MRYYIGVDPGLSGGLVCIDTKYERPYVYKEKMPPSEKEILGWLDLWVKSADDDAFATIEWITPAIFGVGKSSMSKLYGSYMGLRMALSAKGIAYEPVKAGDWQRGLGIQARGKSEDQTKWKNRLKAHAQQLYPGQEITLATSDALLIATYCMRKQQGKLG